MSDHLGQVILFYFIYLVYCILLLLSLCQEKCLTNKVIIIINGNLDQTCLHLLYGNAAQYITCHDTNQCWTAASDRNVGGKDEVSKQRCSSNYVPQTITTISTKITWIIEIFQNESCTSYAEDNSRAEQGLNASLSFSYLWHSLPNYDPSAIIKATEHKDPDRVW